MKTLFERLAVVLVVPVLLFSACAGLENYGKIRIQTAGQQVTIEMLLERWQDYDIHYAGLAVHKPSALLFDPKGDDRTLQLHPWWIKVDQKETLTQIVKWLEFDKYFEPIVWRVLGSDDRFFGYMYTAWSHALIRVVDDKTLWVNELTMPPDYPAGGITLEGGGQ